jgi:putative MATE family efflux protein
VAQGVVMILSTAFRATGDAKTPLIVSSLANIISVLAAYGFAYGAWGLPNMGVNGAAIGAGLALTLSSLCYLLLWMSNRLSLPYSYSCAAPTISMGRFLNICLPATVEQLIMQGGMLLFIGFVASYGTSTFVAFGIGFNFFSITMVIGLGFSIATSALVGQSQGAGDEQAVFDHIRQALSLSVSSMLVIGILSGLFATQLASIIIDNAEVIEIAAQFLLVLAVLQPLLAIEFVLAGAMRGAGYTGFPLVAGIATLLGVRLPLGALVIELQLPVPWLFSVFIVDQAVKVALIYWRFRQKSWLRLS